MGNRIVHTSQSQQYLAIRLEASQSSSGHLNTRIQKATKAFHAIKASGLLGGQHPVSTSLTVVRSKIWTTLDSGTCVLATPTLTRDHKTEFSRIDTLQLQVLRHVLGLSGTASSEGTLGELGEAPCTIREEKNVLSLYSSLVTAPHLSLLARLLTNIMQAATNDHKLLPPFLQQVANILMRNSIAPLTSRDRHSWCLNAKTQLHSKASDMWRARVTQLPHLLYAFPPQRRLSISPYLCIPVFPGRQLVTRIRLDDLPLNAAHRSRSANALCEQ
jgi:hypothetical protein